MKRRKPLIISAIAAAAAAAIVIGVADWLIYSNVRLENAKTDYEAAPRNFRHRTPPRHRSIRREPPENPGVDDYRALTEKVRFSSNDFTSIWMYRPTGSILHTRSNSWPQFERYLTTRTAGHMHECGRNLANRKGTAP